LIETLKVCAAEGCETTLSLYRVHDTLCHEHGRQKAKRGRKKRHDPGELEAFQRALREETLVSLILDPSRWASDNTLGTFGSEGRHRPRARDDNRCPGWMCGAILDAPLPSGQYCSLECKQQTSRAREAFRRELTQLRAAAREQAQEKAPAP
jgi:hypothetical protein